MHILVCSHKRPNRVITYEKFPDEIKKVAKIVIQESDFCDYSKVYHSNRLIVLPQYISTLPQTRQWIHVNMGPKVCMLDDDLVFARRRDDNRARFTPLDVDLEWMFNCIESSLDLYAHVGVSHREGANRNTENVLYVGRMMRVLAYRTDITVNEEIVSDRLPDVEDFDVTLQLLRKGYPNRILNNWVHNQHGSDNSGGCSEYRTPETHARDVMKLAEFHHPFVKVVKKVTKNKWCADENGERTDATIQWKKAYASSGSTDLLDTRKVQNFNT